MNPIKRLGTVVIVALGGFAGANLRFLFGLVSPSPLVGTIAANVLGCLALGFVFYEGQYGGSISPPARTAIATGFLSSFTTYSTFILDAATADPAIAVAYVGGSYALGFAAVLVGRALAGAAVTRYGTEVEH